MNVDNEGTRMSDSYVTYYRVSTHKQGVSGLGLEAQRQAVAGYLSDRARTVLAEFVEVETRAAMPSKSAHSFVWRWSSASAPAPSC